MQEKEFLRKLNSKINQGGSLTLSIIQNELLEEKQNNRKVPILDTLGRIFSTHKTPEQIIQDNLELILQKTSDEYKATLLEKLLENERTRKIIKNKFATILNNLKRSKIPYTIMAYWRLWKNIRKKVFRR